MGLLTALISLPVAPVRGLVWFGERIEEVAERELAAEQAEARLAEARQDYEAGLITDEELAQAEMEVMGRQDLEEMR